MGEERRRLAEDGSENEGMYRPAKSSGRRRRQSYLRSSRSSREFSLLSSESQCSNSSSSYDDAESLYVSDAFDYVSGIVVPEIEEGTAEYHILFSGWLAICIITLLMQVLAVFVLIYYQRHPMECFDHPPNRLDWWILHISKSLSVFIAGCLLGKDIMDVVNYWMVSILMEPVFNKEVALSAISRMSFSFLVSIANIIMFEGMVSPASVWINMAALAFIGELSRGVVDQAKRGVFGISIAKGVTGVTYELTFAANYPWWFPVVQGSTMALMFLFICVSMVVVFMHPDPYCDEPVALF